MSIPKLKSKAAAFTLSDKNGKLHKIRDLDSNYTVLFFYPKDSTPGCTIESKRFSTLLPKFKKLHAAVIGISGGDDNTKQRFCSKHKLKTILLSDTDFAVSKKYGVYGSKSFMGLTFKGIKRTTFVLDSAQRIIKIYRTVKPFGHADEVLEFIKSHTEA